MRRFHLTRNCQWNPTINVDKLWTLVPEEHKKDLKENSQIVPVVNVLDHGYSKVLGNGQLVLAAWIVGTRETERFTLGFPGCQ